MGHIWCQLSTVNNNYNSVFHYIDIHKSIALKLAPRSKLNLFKISFIASMPWSIITINWLKKNRIFTKIKCLMKNWISNIVWNDNSKRVWIQIRCCSNSITNADEKRKSKKNDVIFNQIDKCLKCLFSVKIEKHEIKKWDYIIVMCYKFNWATSCIHQWQF